MENHIDIDPDMTKRAPKAKRNRRADVAAVVNRVRTALRRD